MMKIWAVVPCGGYRHLRGEDRNLSNNSQLLGTVLRAIDLPLYEFCDAYSMNFMLR